MSNRYRHSKVLVVLLLILSSCAESHKEPESHSALSKYSPSPRSESPDLPLWFDLDLTQETPVLTIRSTEQELARLQARYASFHVELGDPVDNVQRCVTLNYEGSLRLPWPIFLPRGFKTPYPVRLVGKLRNGKEEVVHQDSF